MRTLQETRIIKQNGKGLEKYDRYNETGVSHLQRLLFVAISVLIKLNFGCRMAAFNSYTGDLVYKALGSSSAY